MKLYEIAEQYRADVAKLQDLDMPPEAVLDTIDAMQGEISEKIKAVLIVALEMEGEAAIRGEHAKRMAASAKSLEGRAEGLRSYAQIAIQNCGLALPLKFPEFSVNLQRNPPSCEVSDPELLPPHLKIVEATVTIAPQSAVKCDSIAAAMAAAGIGVHGVSIAVKVDKRAVLEALKAVAAANDAKPEADEPDRLPGAHFNPTGYRVTVK